MIITKLRIQEEHPMTSASSVVWPLPSIDLNLDQSAGENGYILQSSAGFGPTPLLAVVVGFDTTGIPIYDNVPEKRLLSFKLNLVPQLGQTMGQLRDALYKLISRSVYIKFMNGADVVAQTTGFIRNMDPAHFTNKPEISFDIECVDGDLAAPLPLVLPLAALNTLTPTIVYEEGTAPTGLDLSFHVNTTHSGFTISNHGEFWHSGQGDVNNQFIVGYTFLNNDVVSLSTHPRSKRLTVLRGGVTTDLAGYINSGAVWPKLYSGVNSFAWTLASSWMNLVSASYIPRYWGV